MNEEKVEKVPLESTRPPHLIEQLKKEDEFSTKKRINWKGILKEILWVLVIVFGVIIPFRVYVAEPYLVDGKSMDPTFETTDYLIVDKISSKAKNPDRNSVVVFKYPENPSKNFIKRIIGLPGETVIVTENSVKIINIENPEGFLLDQPYVVHKANVAVTKKLGDNEYFVMGDNRADSFDSRYWGPLDRKFILGRPVVQLYPLNKIRLMPGTN
jgi:signal peptidase I